MAFQQCRLFWNRFINMASRASDPPKPNSGLTPKPDGISIPDKVRFLPLKILYKTGITLLHFSSKHILSWISRFQILALSHFPAVIFEPRWGPNYCIKNVQPDIFSWEILFRLKWAKSCEKIPNGWHSMIFWMNFGKKIVKILEKS